MSRAWFAFLPNLISLARLVLVPAAVDMIVARNWSGALAIFLIAGISDALDGWIARRYDLRSELGAYLDALADKALLVANYITLAAVGLVPFGLVLLVVSRDLMIVGAVLLVLGDGHAHADQAALPLQGQYGGADRLCGHAARLARLRFSPGAMVCPRRRSGRGIDAGLARGLFQALGQAYDGVTPQRTVGCG